MNPVLQMLIPTQLYKCARPDFRVIGRDMKGAIDLLWEICWQKQKKVVSFIILLEIEAWANLTFLLSAQNLKKESNIMGVSDVKGDKALPVLHLCH